MTITIKATEYVLKLLDGAGIPYTVHDPEKALADEMERGKKFRPRSAKHAQHLERVKRLKEECELDRAAMNLRTHTERSKRTVRPVDVLSSAPANVDTVRQLTIEQEDAIGAIVTLNGVPKAVAMKVVLEVGTGTAQDVIARALALLD